MIHEWTFWKELPFISGVRHLEIIASDPAMFHSSNLSVGFLDFAKKQKPSVGANAAVLRRTV